MSQQLDILQAASTGQITVGDVQEMSGFVIRQMPFEKVNAGVDLIDQATAHGQLMNGADSAIGNHLIAAIEIVDDIAAGHHRLGLIRPVSFFSLEMLHCIQWLLL